MPRLSTLALGAALTALAAGTASAGPESTVDLARATPPAAPLKLGYEVHAGGAHVFTVDTEVSFRPGSYALDLELRTDGWLSWALEWSLRSRVEGAAGKLGLSPARFRTESSWDGKQRWVQLTYGPEGAPRVEAVPPPEEDNRDPVPEDLRAGTIDPLSAGLGLVHALMTEGRCDGDAAVFDGRRRFDAASQDVGPAVVPVSDIAPFGGDAIACRLNITPVTGFWRDQKYDAKPQDVVVFLRPVVEGQPPVPVRIEADSRFGAVRVHLVSVEGAGQAQKADSSR